MILDTGSRNLVLVILMTILRGICNSSRPATAVSAAGSRPATAATADGSRPATAKSDVVNDEMEDEDIGADDGGEVDEDQDDAEIADV